MPAPEFFNFASSGMALVSEALDRMRLAYDKGGLQTIS